MGTSGNKYRGFSYKLSLTSQGPGEGSTGARQRIHGCNQWKAAVLSESSWTVRTKGIDEALHAPSLTAGEAPIIASAPEDSLMGPLK